jgi:hypothetical protein
MNTEASLRLHAVEVDRLLRRKKRESALTRLLAVVLVPVGALLLGGLLQTATSGSARVLGEVVVGVTLVWLLALLLPWRNRRPVPLPPDVSTGSTGGRSTGGPLEIPPLNQDALGQRAARIRGLVSTVASLNDLQRAALVEAGELTWHPLLWHYWREARRDAIMKRVSDVFKADPQALALAGVGTRLEHSGVPRSAWPVVQDAAIALLYQDALSESEFDFLYRPFSRAVDVRTMSP